MDGHRRLYRERHFLHLPEQVRIGDDEHTMMRHLRNRTRPTVAGADGPMQSMSGALSTAGGGPASCTNTLPPPVAPIPRPFVGHECEYCFAVKHMRATAGASMALIATMALAGCAKATTKPNTTPTSVPTWESPDGNYHIAFPGSPKPVPGQGPENFSYTDNATRTGFGVNEDPTQVAPSSSLAPVAAQFQQQWSVGAAGPATVTVSTIAGVSGLAYRFTCNGNNCPLGVSALRQLLDAQTVYVSGVVAVSPQGHVVSANVVSVSSQIPGGAAFLGSLGFS